MEKPSSISSSSRFPRGFVLFVVLAATLELAFFSSGPLISDMSTLSVTRTADLIEEGHDVDVLVMGASRSLAIDAKKLASELDEYDSSYNYSVPSLGTSLQYSMILEKYLDNADKPDIILLALGPEIFGQFKIDALFNSLWSGEADRMRRFFSLPELLEYMPYKEKIFVVPLYLRNILNSYSYRAYVRDYLDFHLFGIEKWGVGDVFARNRRLLQTMENTGGQMVYWPDRHVPIDEMIFENIVPLGGLAEYEYPSFYLRKDENLRRFFHIAWENNIPVVAFLMPVPAPRFALMEKYRNFNYIDRRMNDFEQLFKTVFYHKTDINWDMYYFGDSSHLNAEGAQRFNDQFVADIKQLLKQGIGGAELSGDGLFFDLGSTAEGRVLINGFQETEQNAETGETWRWSDGDASSFRFPWIHNSEARKFRVTITVQPFISQRGREMVLGTSISSTRVLLQAGVREYTVELMFPPGKELQLSVAYENAKSPMEINLSADERVLAVRWINLRLQYAVGG